MIGRIVATHPRREQRGAPHPFVVTHDPNTHAPWGLHRVYLNGREIGRQLSCPTLDDCDRMLRPEPPRTPVFTSYTALAKARREKTSALSQQTLAHRRTEPQEDHYGRLSDAVVLP